MINHTRSLHHSRPDGSHPDPWVAAVALLLLPASVLASDPASIINSQRFNEAFRDYYEALDSYTVKDLEFELSETIDDILSSGSHLTRTSLDYRVRQIERALFSQLRKQLCPPSSPNKRGLSELKRSSVHSINKTGSSTGVNFTHEEVGMISGITVRLLQRKPMEEFCHES